ncbi:molybdopterin-dependent oxidoreductase [Leifsonia sp. Leaf264]|uniref:molybdopterin-dependent oxidoreductase n=1 Tax=Leifsonia sp. Leaf264 TaxID=1736314 RepID=UPI0006FDA1F6|nr:oxidoreductase [Leifsonia sp. Leaf264]
MPGQHGRPGTSARGTFWLSALVGVIAAGVTLGIAELVAVFVGAGSSPIFAVGAWVIDLVPGWFKTLIIDLFGTADKAVLLITLTLLVLVLAGIAGILEYRRPPWGMVILIAVSGVAALAVVTRPDASGILALSTVIGMIGGVVVLRALTARLHRWRDRTRPVSAAVSGTAALDRRSFVVYASVAAVGAAIVGFGARMANAGSAAVSSVRTALTLPAAATPAPPVPTGAELGIPDLSSYVTPNAEFYRIDTALQVPAVDPTTWKLRIIGMVENEVEISWDELLALPLTEHVATLSCVSNEVGGGLIGNALWLGYPIRELLARAKPTAGADMVLSRSADGWTAGTPLDVLQDAGTEALLAVGMNGEPLPIDHGFPVRMVVPGLYGYVSATKWVTELKVTTFADDFGYWSDKGWSEKGPIKTESRIDTPRGGSTVKPGTVAVAGVAWAPHTGIDGVEVRIDDGAWQKAKLADSASADTWRQWVYEWEASGGDHRIEVRATDASGYTQTQKQAPPAPDGATGWHTVTVNVS